MGYGSERNRVYYDRNLYREHMDVAQEVFNRKLKKAQKLALETA